MAKAPMPKMPTRPKAGGRPSVSRKGGLKETSPRSPTDLTGASPAGMGPGVLSAATQALAGSPAAPGTTGSTVQAKPFGAFKKPQTVKVKKPKVSY